MDLKNKIQQFSDKYFNEILDIRRHIHKNPELSFQEFKTSEFICSVLDRWGIKYKKGIVKTGILAEIDGANPGKVLALRADMDALPVYEKNDLPFKSLNEGVMHACGHDVHTGSLLGVIRILNEIRSEFNGKILFIFQPGEEKIPGGAKLMLEEKLFGDDKPDLVLAQHVYPEFEAGKVGFKSGIYMASSDEIYITIKGKGGHGALPESLIDPVLIASQVIVSLQQISSRNNKPGVPTVLSFGKVFAGGAVNVIPDEVTIEGTFRTMDEEWRKRAHELIIKMVKNIAESSGGSAEVEIRHGYPVLHNDEEFTPVITSYAREYLGDEKVKKLDIRMTAEDFAYFSNQYPSIMYRLGTAEPGKKGGALHTSGFYVDESSIKTGMELMSWLSLKFLNS
jgi:amidohydrolase